MNGTMDETQEHTKLHQPFTGRMIQVIGYGNAGRRHAAILRALGCRVVVTDIRDEALHQAERDGYEMSLDTLPWGYVYAISGPTIQQFKDDIMQFKRPCFIEKPGIWSKQDLEASREIPSYLLGGIAVGFQLRAIPHLWRYQRVQHVRIYDWQDMAQWPEATYQRDFLTEFSHEIDLAAGGFSRIERVYVRQRSVQSVMVSLVGGHGEFITVDLKADFRGYERGLVVQTMDQTVESWQFTHEQNTEAYRAQLLAWLEGKPYCTLQDASQTYNVLSAIWRSDALRRWEEVDL
jgi:hypothetical protein